MAEVAHYWRHPAVSGVDLMRARFVRHGFARHSHETFALGVVRTGTSDLWVDGVRHVVSTGGIVLLNPEVVHTGGPVDDVGWAYRVFYPSVEVVAQAIGRRDPWLAGPVVDDPAAAAIMGRAHLAAESADRLAAETLLTTALSVLWRRHGGGRPSTDPPGGPREVAAAREILHAHMVDPPSLGELAELVGTSRFALVSSGPAVTSPRRTRTRSAMPARPLPPRPSVSCGSVIGLVSAMSSRSWPMSIRTVTGPGWRIALVSPSCTIQYASRDTAAGTWVGSPVTVASTVVPPRSAEDERSFSYGFGFVELAGSQR